MRQVGVVGWLGEQRCFFVKHICEVNKMAQSKIDVSGMTSKQDGDRLVEATSNVAGEICEREPRGRLCGGYAW